MGRKGLGQQRLLLTKYFHLTISYKNGDEAQQMFLEDLVLYICKGYILLFSCEKI
jgi:hypothetical protein